MVTPNGDARRLLAVYAHPDDEAFSCGGTMAHYAALGVQITLVCATRGEVGEIADTTLATPENLGQVRERELRTAAGGLGVTDVVFLGYRDSGMAGTPDNDHPDAFMRAPDDDVVGKIVRIIREKRPEVILTFDPAGGYGHPDHIAVHRHTVDAFHAASDPDRYPDLGVAWRPSRLLYSVFTRGMVRNLRDQLAAIGEDLSAFDEGEPDGLGWPDEQVHVEMDVSHTVDAKWLALSSHRTQFGTFNHFRRIPESDAKALMSRESFCLAYPGPKPDTRLDGLFDGL